MYTDDFRSTPKRGAAYYITGLPKTPMPDLTHRWLRATAPVFAVLYAVFGALNWIVRRRMRYQKHDGEHT